MNHYPNHPRFITVAEFDARGQYQNVNVAPLVATESTDTTAVYDVRENQTPVLVPHVAPFGKDWLWSPDAQKWTLIDNYAVVHVYSKSRVEQCMPPQFGDKLTDDMTLNVPPLESGKITYWDAKSDDWAMRDDLTGKQVFNTADPRQSLVLGRDDWAVPEGYTEKPRPSEAYDWDTNSDDWVLNKSKQNEIDRAALKQQLVDAKTSKSNEINNKAQSYIESATGADMTPAFEVQSWSLQGEEAKSWAADKTAPTPTIDIIAGQRGVPLDLMRQKVLEKTLAYERLVAKVVGHRQVLQGQLKAAKTLADVDKIIVNYD